MINPYRLFEQCVYDIAMRGIILAGGSGSRLWPLTKSVNKHLLPVFDKPLVHYPLATLMLAGIRKILIVSGPGHIEMFKSHFGSGTQLGLEIEYQLQPIPGGLPQGIILAENFIANDSFALILGDNIFHGVGLGQALPAKAEFTGAKMICYQVSDPERFGIAEINNGQVISLEEKPKHPKSNLAITGFYFFDVKAIDYAKKLNPSARGELEIVDLLRKYLENDALNYEILPRGTAWLDTGTPDALLEAANYIQVLEKRQGLKVSCIEEIAWRNGWISDSELNELANGINNPDYASYLQNLLKHT